MAATSKKSSGIIEIQPLKLNTVHVRIRGTAPLIMHKWSEKAKRMILDKQTKETKTKTRELKIPFADFISSAYWMTDEPTGNSDEECEKNFVEAVENGARWGFPVTAIKQATASASAYNDIGIPKTKIRAAFFLKGEGPDMLAEVKGSVPHIREDMVRLAAIGSPADIRHRAQFDDWYMDLELTYNVNGPLTLEQIINLLNVGGFTCGIGEWRPEKDGSYGTYVVETVN